MTYERTCKQCGIGFQANRTDALFCSAKCTAKYYRDNDNPEYTHAKKEHVYWFTCDQCGQGYVVNDYANRGGKRAPRFCSVKCKQAAYRQRVSDQAARRQEQETRPHGEPPPGQSQNRSKTGHSGDSGKNQGRHKAHTGQSRHFDAWQVLGVVRGASAAEIRKAYLKLIKQWHPDKNPDNLEEATQMSQRINRAYEMLRST